MMKVEDGRRKAEGKPVTAHRSLVTLFLMLTFAGCSTPKLLDDGIKARYFDDSLSYEHPFTEAASEAARRHAERECTGRKKVAVKSQGTCTLTRCVTNYLCADKPVAADYGR